MDGVSSGHCSGFSNGVNGVVTRLMDDSELRQGAAEACASTLLRSELTITVEADDGERDGKDGDGRLVVVLATELVDEDESELELLLEVVLEAEVERLLLTSTFPLLANTNGGGLGFGFTVACSGGSSPAGTLEVEFFFSRVAGSTLRTLYAM